VSRYPRHNSGRTPTPFEKAELTSDLHLVITDLETCEAFSETLPLERRLSLALELLTAAPGIGVNSLREHISRLERFADGLELDTLHTRWLELEDEDPLEQDAIRSRTGELLLGGGVPLEDVPTVLLELLYPVVFFGALERVEA